jgi:hypothetical protein
MEQRRWYLFSKNWSEKVTARSGCKFYLTCIKPTISIKLGICSGYPTKYSAPSDAIPAAMAEALELVEQIKKGGISSEAHNKKIIGSPIIPGPIAIE